MDFTRARTFHALFISATLATSATGSWAATTEAHIEYGWLSAFQFDLSSGLKNVGERSTLVYSGVNGEVPTLVSQTDWTPLDVTRSSAQSFATSKVSAEISNIDVGSDNGEGLGYSAVTALLSYTGIVPKSFDILVPFKLMAVTSVGGASARADVFAELQNLGESSPFKSSTASVLAEIIGTPDEESGFLSLLNITFQPEQQMLLTISGLATVTSPPAPVPLPTPAILLASAVLGLIGIRRR